MRTVRVAATLLAMAVAVGACGTSSGNQAKHQSGHMPQEFDRVAVEQALLKPSDLPATVSARNQPPMTVGLDTQSMSYVSQKQPLNGAIFSPATCASMLNSGFPDVSKLQGLTRVFANRTDPAKGGGQPFQGGMVANAVVPGPASADLARVLRTVATCANGTVTLTAFNVTGKLTQRVVTPPKVGADGVISFKQTVTFPKLPAQAQGFATMFNADAVYMTKGNMTVWVSTNGDAGVAAADLAPRALERAVAALD
jgi:hypothetical protein